MAMAKINISMPDGLVEDLDEIAAWLKRSRSGIIQEASAMYVTMLHEQRAAEERQADIGTARREMKKLAKDLGAFDGTAAVRADRDGHGRKAGQR
ncbi:MAG: ribbon-helix-helix protein, CopG family [Coriobacteriia bacterium]|nr:ribbon-helix-helix protein, CopG family [Coriobacteriia bacterium]